MHNNSFTLFFAAIITVVCSLLLASAATLLRDRQQENIELDKKTNILASVGIKEIDGHKLTRQDVLRIYKERIHSIVINKQGEEVAGRTVESINPKKDTDLLPVYFCMSGDSLDAYIIPISGKGLWSTIYGYLALDKDAVTVKGITFYQHGETPGLGGEIEKDWFTNNFTGKRIKDEQGNLVSITVVKGKLKDRISNKAEWYHYVDGISGASLTGRGVTNFLKKDLEEYQPYFTKIENKEGLE